jgi:hypothetical protein
MAVLAQGLMKAEIDTSTTGGPTYTNVSGVTNIAGGGRPANDIDATDFDTAAGTTETIPGPRGNSPFTFDLQYEPGDVGQEALFTAEAANTSKLFRIKMGTKQITFSAVPTLSLSAPVAGKVTYSVSLTPLVAAVRGAYAA